ncbi:hypothetical protein [Pantoea sp. BAV 3049]|uniref:hypothetical protein n=1 Tax=Pantoea sp. BAV 3049 TaxID=2654188 RepID=UPI00131E76A0|nr:hypothetical protein [Pantoea sp. BAV 3049]
MMKEMNPYKNIFIVGVMAVLFSANAFAGGGLSAGSTALQTFLTWLFGIVCTASSIHFIYVLIMIKVGTKGWGEALISLGGAAIAGAALVATQWAQAIFQ